MRVLNFKLVPNFWKIKVVFIRQLPTYLTTSRKMVQRLKKPPWLLGCIILMCLLTMCYFFGYVLKGRMKLVRQPIFNASTIQNNFSFDAENDGTMVARKNIVFLKTHKCASSTIQNILLRYGESHNLTFVLPTKMNYLGHPEHFNRIFVPYPTDKMEFNILAHHSRFNYEEMSLLMPEDTVFITIVRKPSDLMESLYQYYLLEDYYKISLEDMVKNKSLALKIMKTNRYYTRVGFNQMSFDLGLEPGDFFNAKVVKRFCHLLDKQFDLVMVAERSDESLILLMELMRWTLDDVVSFKLNARKARYKSTLTPMGLNRLRELSLADEIVYEHFRQKFEDKIEQFGRDKMSNQLERLREKQREIYASCVDQVKDSDSQDMRTVPSNLTLSYYDAKYLVEYRLKSDASVKCQRMILSELKFTDILRSKQDKRYFEFASPKYNRNPPPKKYIKKPKAKPKPKTRTYERYYDKA